MAEPDVFERRLRAALVRHVDGGPADFDAMGFARAVAAKEPRRHGLGVILGWRRFAVPQVAWVVLLLAALLAAMVGGALIAGSQTVRKVPAVLPPLPPAFTCPPGSTPDEPGPADQARPIWPTTTAFDRQAGRLVALAEIYDQAKFDGTRPVGVETWTFDVCTNTWTRMHPNREPPARMSRLVYDVDSDITIGVHYEDWLPYPESGVGNVWAYDLRANTWTEKGAASGYLMFYDPASGLVLGEETSLDETAPTELLTYDVEADTWTPVHQAFPRNLPGGQSTVYDASVDRVIAPLEGDDGDNEPWLFDIRTGAWSPSGARTPAFRMGMWAMPTVVYDEAAERTVVAANNRWGAYDATANQWEILLDGGAGAPLGAPEMVYDPTNRRLIVPGGGPAVSGDLVAFDLVTREWTVLVE